MKLFRAGIVVTAVAIFGSLAVAQTTTTYTGPSTGTFENGANYSNGAPSSTNGPIFSPSSSTTITINQTTTDTIPSFEASNGGTLNFNSGGNTLTVTGGTPQNGIENINITGGSTVNYSGGTLIFNDGAFQVGNATGTGTFLLSSGTINYDIRTSADSTQIAIGNQGTGTFIQAGNSVVNMGEALNIGVIGGNGSYTLTQNSTLQTGTNLTTYVIAVGVDTPAGSGSQGLLTISDNSTLDLNAGGYLVLGTGSTDIGSGTTISTSSATGVVTQNGSGSTVNVGSNGNGAIIDVGDFNGATGTYNLQAGTLNVNVNSTLDIAATTGATGIFNQSGGTINAAVGSAIGVGDNGTGTFNLSGGTANLLGGFEVGGFTGDTTGSGTFNQSGGTLISGAAIIGGASGTPSGTYNLSGGNATFNGDLTVGENGILKQTRGTGTYNGAMIVDGGGTVTQTAGSATFNGGLVVDGGGAVTQAGGNATFNDDLVVDGNGTVTLTGGNATFNSDLVVDGNGTVTQTGGTLVIASGNTLDLSAPGGSYNLNGGTLEVGNSGVAGLTGGTGDGTLNFGGGTLQVGPGSTTLVDGLDGTVNGTSTLDTTNGNITLSGTLTGGGGFNIIGGNAVNLNTASALYTGNTNIDASTLNLTAAAATGDTSTFGSISGASGNFNIIFANNGSTLQLTGTNDFLGTTAIGDGTTTGNTLGIASGTFGNFSAGNGGLLIGGVGSGGTVNLVGTNLFTGATTVASTFALMATNLDSTIVTNNGTLGLLSSTPVGTAFTVGTGGTGDLIQPTGAPGSPATETLLIRTAPGGADQFQVGSGTLFQDIGVSGYGHLGQNIYTIVTSATPLTTGTLNGSGGTGLEVVTNSLLLSGQLSLTNGNTDLVLTTTQLGLSQFATTPNQRAVANSLDTGLNNTGSNPLFADFNRLTTPSQLSDVLDQLTPRGALYMRDIAFENSTFLAQTIGNNLANIRNGMTGWDTSGLSIVNPGLESGLGRDMMAFNNQQTAPNGVDYYPDDGDATSVGSPSPSPLIEPSGAQTISDTPDPRMAPTGNPAGDAGFSPSFNEFISGDAVAAELNQNRSGNNEPKAHYAGGDATAGIAFHMTSNLAAGVLFDYNHTDARTDSQGSHIRVDTYSPGVFATFFEKGFYVNALGTVGFNNYSDNRNISFGGLSTSANSSPTGQQYVGNLDLGYDFHPVKHLVIGPTLGVEYTHLDIDSYSESGAGPADLNVDKQGADSLRSRIGAHAVYWVRAGNVVFQPNITASWQHEFLNDPFDLTSTFNDLSGTPAFDTQGSNPGRDSALLGFGVTATLDNSLSFYLNYLADVGGEDYFVETVEGGLKASF